jgi:hypothetical protein
VLPIPAISLDFLALSRNRPCYAMTSIAAALGLHRCPASCLQPLDALWLSEFSVRLAVSRRRENFLDLYVHHVEISS